MTVFLRPQPAATPVDYLKSLEKQGLIVMPQRNLALYTCSTGQGPKGDKGDQGEPYLYDTIISSASTEYGPLSVDLSTPATHFRAPYPLNIVYVRASLSIAATGADLILDIKMNGASIFTPGNLLTIDAGSKTSVGSASPPAYAITAVPDDAEFTVFVTQVGSTLTGAGIKVSITGTKEA